jgi:hypothetical protein
MQNNSRKRNNEEDQNLNPVNQVATLEFIAAIILTLGEGLSAVAAALALQEAKQETEQGGSVDLQPINQQLNYLTKEVGKIKKSLNI